MDLTGQTSASFNMRLNYERCLLDFENYLACGQARDGLGRAGVASTPTCECKGLVAGWLAGWALVKPGAASKPAVRHTRSDLP